MAMFGLSFCLLVIGASGSTLPDRSGPPFSEEHIGAPQIVHVASNDLELIRDFPVKVPGNANEYLDYVLSLARPIIANSGLDPLFPLPEVHSSFENDVLGVTWYGEVGLYNGFIFGLSSLTRSGDCTLETSGFNMTFTGAMGLVNMQAGYRVHYDLQGVGDDADVNALIRYVSAKFSSSTNLLTGTTNMNTFEILDMGDIDIEFSGFDGLDWVANEIADIVIDSLKDEIINALENAIGDLLECIISATSGDQPGSIEACIPLRKDVKVIHRLATSKPQAPKSQNN